MLKEKEIDTSLWCTRKLRIYFEVQNAFVWQDESKLKTCFDSRISLPYIQTDHWRGRVFTFLSAN